MTAPRITAEAFYMLQAQAEAKGHRLTRSESNGTTRVWLDGREVVSLDDLEAIVMHARNAIHPPIVPTWPGVDLAALLDGNCCACGAAKASRQAETCDACAVDATLCARLASVIAATPEGITAALIERASRP